MSFEIESPTTAKLVDVVILSQKNRQPDENPGAKLSFDAAVSNDVLSYFDNRLLGFLFTKNGGEAKGATQGSLDGVPVVSDTPNLTRIGEKVGALHWDDELTGYTLTIDHGMGGKSNPVLEDCTVSNFRLIPREGGTVNVRFDAESNHVSEKVFGKLATLKTREIKVTLTAPDVVQDDIEDGDAVPAAKVAKPRRDTRQTPEQALAAQFGG
jgi:hypothetical protein